MAILMVEGGPWETECLPLGPQPVIIDRDEDIFLMKEQRRGQGMSRNMGERWREETTKEESVSSSQASP